MSVLLSTPTNLSQTDQATLADSALLRGIDSDALQYLLRDGKIYARANESFFFMEEEPAERGYVLLAGKVKLTQLTPDGQQVILGYLSPGRVFGIICIIKKILYPVSAQAVGECRAFAWEQHTLLQAMETQPRLALNAMYIMAGQIREFQNKIRELATQRVEQRIARMLIRLAKQSGQKTAEGILIDLPLSRQDLAEMTGCTLFTVSRALKEWEKRGLLLAKRQQIVITAPHGLMTIAEDLPFYQPLEDNQVCDL